MHDSIKLSKFKVKGKPFTQLSDHYGVSVKFKSDE